MDQGQGKSSSYQIITLDKDATAQASKLWAKAKIHRVFKPY